MIIDCGIANGAKQLLQEIERMEKAEEKALPLKAKVKSFTEFEKVFEARKVHVTFEPELSDFDRQVLTGICNLWYSGRRFITADQIIDAVWEWRLETFESFERKKQVWKVIESVTHMLSVKMTAKKFGRSGGWMSGWLLPANTKIITYRSFGGFTPKEYPVNDLIEIESEPLVSRSWRSLSLRFGGEIHGYSAVELDKGVFPDLD